MEIPRFAAGVLAALQFRDASTKILESNEQWEETLAFADRTRLTLILAGYCREVMPDWAGRRTDENFARNAERAGRLKRALFEIEDRFDRDGAVFLAMRGVTHWQDYVPAPVARCQYDIDLFCPPESLLVARDLLVELGYEPLAEMDGFPTDHLPVMVRKTGWQWRGDFFDPEIPFSVDLHFRFWDRATERFDVPGTEQFWERRTAMCVDGRSVPCLHPADNLAASSLHLLRHLLRGALLPSHVYEIAWFLDTHAGDRLFWTQWREFHPERLRQLQAIAFRLASDWFQCAMPEAAAEEVNRLPEPVRQWFEEYGNSPLKALFRPNKDELWLHFALLESTRDKARVFARRMAPARMPPPVGAWSGYAAYVARRAAWHALSAPGVFWEGARWWLRTSGISRTFWPFLGVGALFDLGLAIFFLLYNLFLLDLGFRENFLGAIASAMTAGSIAGTLPAGVLGRRFGLRKCLIFCLAGAAVISGSRALVAHPTALVALAFLDGVVAAVWAVSYVPAIAQSVSEKQRPLGYMLCTVEGIAMGVVAGLIGGWMPGWLLRAGAAATPLAAKRDTLLVGCAMALAGVLPAWRLHLPPTVARSKTLVPKGPFIIRFLVAIAVWNLATGAFNPFFNAYFARYLHQPVERIGLIHSASQLAQVAALMAAPLILRKLGMVRGITAMQLATGVALAALGAASLGPAAPFLYAGYMSFQWMSEPGLYSFLMNHVTPEQQSGASALNFLVIFAMDAIAAAVAGAGFTRYGYPLVLSVAGAVAVLGALLFGTLLSSAKE